MRSCELIMLKLKSIKSCVLLSRTIRSSIRCDWTYACDYCTDYFGFGLRTVMGETYSEREGLIPTNKRIFSCTNYKSASRPIK